jgi:putative transposase
VLSPIAAPQANAIAERLIGTLRRECLDHGIVVNERRLRHVLRDFIHHDNAARPHQALALQVPDQQSRARPAMSGRIVSRPVLAGLTHEYEWEAG